jgi:gliding motility-associated-like protein
VDGFNDDFMPGYKVVIYDRYGNIVCNSNDGWDGIYRGETAEPGVYMYVITLKDGRVVKGTIEVFRK